MNYDLNNKLTKNQRFLNIAYAKYDGKNDRWSLIKMANTEKVKASKVEKYGPVAPQLAIKNDLIMSESSVKNQSEQCHNLNIFRGRKNNNSQQGHLPVMVWIHGGGFTTGASSLPIYDGSYLAEATNTLVITLNYRLGSFGFLRLVDVTNNEITSTGNEGLEDQITALKWIQENIHLYGGDKDNITLFGESAGAMSIACLLSMPNTKGLFHKAILQSGAGHSYQTIAQANNVAKAYLNTAESLGYNASQLATLSTSEIMNIQKFFLGRPDIYKAFGILPFKPVIGTQGLPLAPFEAIAQGCAIDIPIISGTNTDEWTLFAAMLNQNIQDEQALQKALRPLIGEQHVAQCLTLMSEQCKQRELDSSPQNILNEVFTEFWFNQPNQRLLEAQLKAGGEAYNYKLGRRSVIPALRCSHIIDIGLVFNHLSKGLYGEDKRVNELVDELQTCWGTFAYNGSPSSSSIYWPKVSKLTSEFVFFDHHATCLQPIDQDKQVFWSLISHQKLASF
ncbi:MAG: carboxylesterase family protein [Alteromonadaceae bacterium]